MIQEVNNIDRNGIVDRFMVWIVLLIILIIFNFKENEMRAKAKKYLPKFSLRFGIFAARICCKTSWTLNKN
tara:strand:- start:19 stop:231 length:213 start_codon:yes stop_codon:yes gene_type:complete